MIIRLLNHMRRQAIGCVALFLALSGIAWASGFNPMAANGVIHACYRPPATAGATAPLEVMDASQACPAGETGLDFNQQGPRGTTGDQGPQGPQGQTAIGTGAPSPPGEAQGFQEVDPKPVPLLHTIKAHAAPQTTVAELALPVGSYFVFAKGQATVPGAAVAGRQARTAGIVIEERPSDVVCRLGQAQALQGRMLDRAALSAAGRQSFSLQVQATVTSLDSSEHVSLKCDVARIGGGAASAASRRSVAAQVSEIKLFALRTQ